MEALPKLLGIIGLFHEWQLLKVTFSEEAWWLKAREELLILSRLWEIRKTNIILFYNDCDPKELHVYDLSKQNSMQFKYITIKDSTTLEIKQSIIRTYLN